MKNWLKQTSTIGGLLSLAATGLQAYQTDGNAVTVVMAVISAALLLVKDGTFLTGLSLVMLLSTTQTACSAISIPVETQVAAATAVGCAVIEESGCYAELSAALPELTADTCPDTVSAVLAAAVKIQAADSEDRASEILSSLADVVLYSDSWDPTRVDVSALRSLESGNCSRLGKYLGVQ